MLLTRSIIKFNRLFVRIPRQTKKEFGTYPKIDGDINNF